VLLPVGFLLRGRRRRTALVSILIACSLGCGDRINTEAASSVSVSYNITVIGTATSASGSTLQHTAVVMLTLQ